MYYPYFDNFTIGFYLFLGTLCMLSVRLARGSSIYNRRKSIQGLTMLFIILLLFAGLRKVGLHLGGEDAERYQTSFKYCLNHGMGRLEDTDILYGILIKLIRNFTDNVFIFRFICYGLIAFGYVYFIKIFCPQGVSSIPFICILIPYMRSLNTMRNTMSIALFLISIVFLYKDKKLWCFIFVVGSVFMHRLSFLMISFFPFFLIFKNFISRVNKIKFFLFTLAFIVISYLLAVQLQRFIIIFSLFDGNGNSDFWYLTKGEGKNILLNWPMYLVHVLLFIAVLISYTHLPTTRQVNFLKVIFVFDIIMMPTTLVLGMWRFAEYFYISNLILWGVLISVICNKFSIHSRILLKSIIAVGFNALLFIRLYQEWEAAALMPYLFFWQ